MTHGGDDLRIGVIGLGRWGANYCSTLSALPGVAIVGAADRSADARARANLSCPVVADLETLLATDGLEAVIIATPDPTHYDFARRSLESGCHVLVEKPMTTDAARASELAALAEARGLVLAVGHVALYHPGIEQLRTRLAARAAGTPVAVAALRTSAGPRSGGSDLLWDLGPHDTATTVALFGEPTTVRSSGGGTAINIDMVCAGELPVTLAVAYRPGPAERWYRVDWPDSSFEHREIAPAGTADAPLRRQCADFARCCTTGGQPASSGRLGVAVTRCLEAAARSLASGGCWQTLTEPMPCR